jgi:hypothetical protein
VALDYQIYWTIGHARVIGASLQPLISSLFDFFLYIYYQQHLHSLLMLVLQCDEYKYLKDGSKKSRKREHFSLLQKTVY